MNTLCMYRLRLAYKGYNYSWLAMLLHYEMKRYGHTVHVSSHGDKANILIVAWFRTYHPMHDGRQALSGSAWKHRIRRMTSGHPKHTTSNITPSTLCTPNTTHSDLFYSGARLNRLPGRADSIMYT